ncbi:MAG TPA: hypothetical protein VEE84_05470 [Burkholderiaceae bacterium]|nr:hypothetical protein [Burkholderiaceae bacterium]
MGVFVGPLKHAADKTTGCAAALEPAEGTLEDLDAILVLQRHGRMTAYRGAVGLVVQQFIEDKPAHRQGFDVTKGAVASRRVGVNADGGGQAVDCAIEHVRSGDCVDRTGRRDAGACLRDGALRFNDDGGSCRRLP